MVASTPWEIVLIESILFAFFIKFNLLINFNMLSLLVVILKRARLLQ